VRRTSCVEYDGPRRTSAGSVQPVSLTHASTLPVVWLQHSGEAAAGADALVIASIGAYANSVGLESGGDMAATGCEVVSMCRASMLASSHGRCTLSTWSVSGLTCCAGTTSSTVADAAVLLGSLWLASTRWVAAWAFAAACGAPTRHVQTGNAARKGRLRARPSSRTSWSCTAQHP